MHGDFTEIHGEKSEEFSVVLCVFSVKLCITVFNFNCASPRVLLRVGFEDEI